MDYTNTVIAAHDGKVECITALPYSDWLYLRYGLNNMQLHTPENWLTKDLI